MKRFAEVPKWDAGVPRTSPTPRISFSGPQPPFASIYVVYTSTATPTPDRSDRSWPRAWPLSWQPLFEWHLNFVHFHPLAAFQLLGSSMFVNRRVLRSQPGSVFDVMNSLCKQWCSDAACSRWGPKYAKRSRNCLLLIPEKRKVVFHSDYLYLIFSVHFICIYHAIVVNNSYAIKTVCFICL